MLPEDDLSLSAGIKSNFVLESYSLPQAGPLFAEDLLVRIDSDTKIVNPSVSYLSQLARLAMHKRIGNYWELGLDKEYTTVDPTSLAMLASKASVLTLQPGTKLSDSQWSAIRTQAEWNVKVLGIACDMPDYGIVTRTETVFISKYSPSLVAGVARAFKTNKSETIRCRKIGLDRDMENKESVGRDLSREIGWTLSQNSRGYIILQKQ